MHWEAEDPDTVVNCGASQATGTLKLKMLDPERVATGVRVAYELRNFDQPCAGRASASDFTVAAGFKAYDEDGTLLTGASATIPSDSFR